MKDSRRMAGKVSVTLATAIMALCVMSIVNVIAADVTGTSVIRPNLTHKDTAGLSNPTESVGTVLSWTVAAGTGADQMDLFFVDQRTLTNSASEELDMYSGVTNSFGSVLSFARIKMIIIKGATANASYITAGGSTNGAFTNWVDDATDQINIRPGGAAAFFAPAATGYPVTSGTGDKLLITNPSTNTVTYDIYIGGASS